MRKNAFAAGSPPRTPLRELTELTKPVPRWIWGMVREGGMRRRRGESEKEREG